MVFDSAGNLYGTTFEGGTGSCNSGCGTVFKLAPSSHSGWRESVIYNFQGGSDGQYPQAGLTLDSAGNLYGTTIGGVFNQACGGYTCGEVFEMSPQRNGMYKFTVLHKFVGTDGDIPLGVILDGKGNLFGTTKDGGTYGAGTAFELTP